MKRVAFGIMLLAVIALLASCGTGTPTASEPNGNNGVDSGSNTGQSQPTAEETNNTAETISVYYSDHQLSELLTEQREITYQDAIGKYKAAIHMLEQPEDPSHAPLWRNFKYHSLTFAEGKITIDTDGANQYNLGSTGEMMAIKALTQTLFQFPEVEEVLFLVDGQTAESLMGHVDISQPFVRDDK